MPTLAYFVTPHGFGHAARAAAIMHAIQRLDRSVVFIPVTTVPNWFFTDSGVTLGGYLHASCDVGLVQNTATQADLESTATSIRALYPPREEYINSLASQLRELHCTAIICDIAPLGLHVAKALNVVGIMVDHFSWDWIYAGYASLAPQLAECAALLRACALTPDLHIQTTPVCTPAPGAHTVAPVSRAARRTRATTRAQLRVAANTPLVLLSFGGVLDTHAFVGLLKARKHITFLVSAPVPAIAHDENIVFFSPRSDLFHPDLLLAADALVGKAGYGTVAEAYYAGIPFGIVDRPYFLEAPILRDFVHTHQHAIDISEKDFRAGLWIARLDELLAAPHPRQTITHENGADQAARLIIQKLNKT